MEGTDKYPTYTFSPHVGVELKSGDNVDARDKALNLGHATLQLSNTMFDYPDSKNNQLWGIVGKGSYIAFLQGYKALHVSRVDSTFTARIGSEETSMTNFCKHPPSYTLPIYHPISRVYIYIYCNYAQANVILDGFSDVLDTAALLSQLDTVQRAAVNHIKTLRSALSDQPTPIVFDGSEVIPSCVYDLKKVAHHRIIDALFLYFKFFAPPRAFETDDARGVTDPRFVDPSLDRTYH